MRIDTLTEPAVMPVFLDAVKDHLRIEHADADAEIGAFIAAATDAIETKIGCYLISRTVAVYLDQWPAPQSSTWWDGVQEGMIADVVGSTSPLNLIGARPLQSVSSIEVFDQYGTPSTWAAINYHVTTGDIPKITPKSAVPNVGLVADGIKITAVVGYGDSPNSIPPALQAAVKNLVAHLWQNRGAVGVGSNIFPQAVEAFLKPYQLRGNRVRF